MQSLILKAAPNSSGKSYEISGVAYSGGTGNPIASVEVSTNDGTTWTTAKILSEEVEEDGSHKSFGWVRWNVTIERGDDETEVCCRATDSEGKTQVRVSPKQRGYLYNGWSKVSI